MKAAAVVSILLAGAVLSLNLASHALSQGPRPVADPARDAALERLMLEANGAAEQAQIAKRRADRESCRQLLEKFNLFVVEMNRLGHEYEVKGTFNIKQAAIVTKAWRKLHADPGWLEKDKRD